MKQNTKNIIWIVVSGLLMPLAMVVIVVSVGHFGNDYTGTLWHWLLAILVLVFWVYRLRKFDNLKETDIKLAKALKKVGEALQDPGYRESWKSSIAMAIKDESNRVIKKKNTSRLSKADIHDIANIGAENFINILTNGL